MLEFRTLQVELLHGFIQLCRSPPEFPGPPRILGPPISQFFPGPPKILGFHSKQARTNVDLRYVAWNDNKHI